MTSSRSKTKGLETQLPATRVGFASLIILAPHLLGGIFAWGSALVAAWSCALAGLVFWEAKGLKQRRFDGVEVIPVALAVPLVITALQVIPLPAGLVSLFAPTVAGHGTATAELLGEKAPSWFAFSLDPGNSYERILYGAAVLSAFCVARMIASYSRSTWTAESIALSAIGVAISQLLHRGLGMGQVYGLYEPRRLDIVGPLLNSNNLAGFMCLGGSITLGLAIHNRGVTRYIWALATALLWSTVLLTVSRGGLLATVGGVALFALLYWGLQAAPAAAPNSASVLEADADAPRAEASRKGRRSGRGFGQRLSPAGRSTVLIGFAGLLAYGLAEWAGDDFIDKDFGNVTKLALLGEELQFLVSDWHRLLFGVGRGGFAAAFAGKFSGAEKLLFAESLPLQYGIEFGAPLALAIMAAFAAVVGRAVWRARSSAHLGALVGVIALTVQNFFDFSLELSAIAVVAAAALATGLPFSSRAWKPWQLDLRKMTGAAAALSGFLVLASAHAAVNDDIDYREVQLEALIHGHRRAEFEAVFPRLAAAHPASPAIAILGAADAVMARKKSAPAWLNRAMELAPGWSSPHQWAAHWLASQGRWDQAATELRLAAERDPYRTVEVLCAWVRTEPSADLALRAVPEQGKARDLMLDWASSCLANAPAESEKLDQIILAERPAARDATIRSVARSLARGDAPSALARVQELRKTDRGSGVLCDLEGQVWLGLKNAQRAIAVLERCVSEVYDPANTYATLARAQLMAGNMEEMRRTVHRLREDAAGEPVKLTQALQLLAQLERQAGNSARSLAALSEAYTLSQDHNVLEAAARYATEQGDKAFALHAWNTLCSEEPNRPEYCDTAQSVRESIKTASP